MADIDTARLVVSLEARVNSYQKALDRAQKSTDTRMAGIARSVQRPQKDFDRLGQAAERLNAKLAGSLKSFGAGLLGGFAAGGVSGIVSQIGQITRGIAEIGDTAKRAGVSVRAFQELKFVAEQNRIDVGALADGLKELQNRADEWITTGSGPAAEAFQRLGYTASELAEKLKDPSALLVEIIGRVQKLDQAARIRVLDQIFAGQGGEAFLQLLDKGEAGLRKQIETAHELGVVMSDELVAKAAELDAKFQAVASTVGTALKKAIVEAASAIQGLAGELDRINQGYEARKRAVDAGAEVGGMVGAEPPVNRSTEKGDRLKPISVPFNPLPADDTNRRVQLAAAREQVARQESAGSGGYRALGPVLESGDRAYGRYQVMGSNIADWTKRAIGTALTSEQFLNMPQVQDKVFDHIFGGYIERFGMEGAAQAWFGGAGAVGKTGRTDALGTSVGDYGDRFAAGVGKATDAWEGLRQVTVDTDQATQAMTSTYDAFGSLAQTAIGGLANALADSRIEGRELLQILMQVMQQLLSMPQISGPGGLLSSLFGGGFGGGAAATGMSLSPMAAAAIASGVGGLYHSGGTVGAGSVPSRWAGSFAGAKRLHTGTRAGEFKAILQRGEEVLSRRDRARTMATMGGLVDGARASGAGQPGQINIRIEGAHGDREIQAMIGTAIDTSMSRYDYQKKNGGTANDQRRYNHLKRQGRA